MGRWKYGAILFGCLALCCLSGCFVQSADSLYALPRQSDAYYDLQQAIDAALPADAAYAGPLTGPNQQAVQLADLDGDGDDEALAFTKTSGEKPLKLYIFDAIDGQFAMTTVIEGDGTAFDAVEYVSVDDTPGLEIILGRQLSDQIVQSLSVYAYDHSGAMELMHSSYSEYKVVDLNLDDRQDVLILRQEAESGSSVAEYYSFRDGMMELAQTVPLSKGVVSIERITTGYVSEDIPGVFITSTYGEDGLITDVLAFLGQTFSNLTLSAESGMSTQLVRSLQVYAADIDEDGLMELPTLVALPSATAGEETYWLVEWYGLKTSGTRVKKLTTFYNPASGWYLIIPELWVDQITISRSSPSTGVVCYTFSQWSGRNNTPEEIACVYIITGDDRQAQAQSQGRFLLMERGEVAYAASLGKSDLAAELDQERFQDMFHLIQVNWNSGET